MKKQIFILSIAALVSVNVAKSQCTTPVNNANNGTNNYVPKFNAAACITNSLIQDNGTNVGIGAAPSYKLDVSGDINFGGTSPTTTNALFLGTNKILWHNGNAGDIFVGVLAGNATMTGHSNVCLGFASGLNIGSGFNNVFIGYGAGFSNTSGINNVVEGTNGNYNNQTGGYNTVCGNEAGKGVFGYSHYYNSFFGYQAGFGTTNGGNNVFSGYQAGYSNTSSEQNVAIGYQALKSQTWANANNDEYPTYNVAVGNYALFSNNPSATTNGINNTAVGYSAGYYNSRGIDNTYTGFESGKGTAITNVNSYNSAFGYQAGYGITSGGNNVFSGYQAGYTNTTGGNNVFVGSQAGYFNSTGIGNTYTGFEAGKGTAATNVNSYNSAFGYQSLPAITTGSYVCTYGFQAGLSNNSGGFNTFMGGGSATQNTSGAYNTFLGFSSGNSNTTASYNVSVGARSSYYNATGVNNTVCGYQAGRGYSSLSATGGNNSFFGYNAGVNNDGSSGNTAIGYQAGLAYRSSTGINNTYLGNGADATGAGNSTYSNSTAIGNGALSDGSGYAIIGNTTVNQIGGWLAWTNKSDGRFKMNVQENVKGLEFIKMLRPVTYQMDTRKGTEFLIKNMPDSIKSLHMDGVDFAPSTSIIHSGFVAQEVEQCAKSCDFKCSIVVAPADTSNGSYGISYAEIVVPLVKAVQELSHTVDSLLAAGKSGQRTNNSGDNSQGKTETTLQVELANNNQIILYQNQPNPFDGSTVIRYFIPENVSGNAYIGFYDMYGKEIKKLEITERGFGKIEASTENLASGIYSYSIVIDGKTIDSKTMVKSK